MSNIGFNQDDTETFLSSKDFQISNAIWSIEIEFARLIKLARENITSEIDDIHWLRIKLKEWDEQLSLIERKVTF